MKSLISKPSGWLFLPLMWLLAPIFLTGQGIQFSERSWEDILAAAKRDNKPIFVDAYTTWCGPCKMLVKDVFPQKEIGDFYNAHFINAHFDMEKGEGMALAKRYNVQAYPTLLFINGDGNIIHRFAGYLPPVQFLEMGKTALDTALSLGAKDARYKKGDRDPEFLYQYTEQRRQAFDNSHYAIAEEYLRTQSDWTTPRNLEFIYKYADDLKTEMFHYLLNNRGKFEAAYGKENVTERIQNIVYEKIFDDKASPSLGMVDSILALVYPDRAKRLSASYRMVYSRNHGDREGYAQAAIDYFNQYADNAEELNEAAYTFTQVIEKKSLLKKAVKWAKRSMELDPDQYYNSDTLAELYFKMGKKCKARKAAKLAIGLAEKNGEDASATRELLEKIEKK